MKTVLRSLVFIAFLLTMHEAKAQCEASDIFISNLVPQGSQTPGTCNAKFDLNFTMQNNNGNKFIFLHVWTASAYPDFFDCVDGEPGGNGAIAPPEGADLAASIFNIGINNDNGTPVPITVYPPDNNVTLNSYDSVSKRLLPDGSAVFIVHGITATLPFACDSAVVLVADLWSSQAAQGQVAQCVNCNIRFAINFTSTAGLANCANLTYNALLTNRIGLPFSGYYRVYADANLDGVLSTSSDSLIRDTTAFTLGAGVGTQLAINGTIPAVNINQNLFIVFNITTGVGSGSLILTEIVSTLCAPLPVNFLSFDARRVSNSSNVSLKWETSTEINNFGFNIQRNVNGTWVDVAFVPSQAPSGNSTTNLVYTFNDVNSHRGMSQYRIRQQDYDGRSKYSEIRAVRGIDMRAKLIVYPNPSSGEKINVVFEEEEGIRDVTLIDMSGRVVRQWRNVTGNTMQISNLDAGVYTIRVINQATGNQSVEKLVINRH